MLKILICLLSIFIILVVKDNTSCNQYNNTVPTGDLEFNHRESKPKVAIMVISFLVTGIISVLMGWI